MSTHPKYTRSHWALAILSLLNERPMHPYEMRRLVRERGNEQYMDLRPGSLYRTIEQLERAGLIEPAETSRQGRFPERTVYRATERGKGELEEWLRELLSSLDRDLPQLVLALSFLPHLKPGEVRAQLEGRIVFLEAQIAASDAMTRELGDVLPRLFRLEDEYVRALRRADLEYVRGLVEDLRAGRLTWSREDFDRYGSGDRQSLSGLRIVDADEGDGAMT